MQQKSGCYSLPTVVYYCLFTMWLINTTKFTIHNFVNHEHITYAILSHTWLANGEVSFSDIHHLNEAKLKPGWSKIEQSCKIARSMDLEYIWIDTCCIDKSSSAELSESINSMFKWYQDSTICMVYLEDLPAETTSFVSMESEKQLGEDLKHCRWFLRGWTLQELIAPKRALFYDSGWIARGSKKSLESDLSQITGIPWTVLRDSDNLSMICVARRMSWASTRTTTRVEDMAYSLLGIFDINMPLIYGEGQKAFIRLQEAIVQQTNDLSVFAWTSDVYQKYHGMFASSPQQFRGCRQMEDSADPMVYERVSFELTNRGLRFQNILTPQQDEVDYLMDLHCRDLSIKSASNATLAIRLTKKVDGFVRHRVRNLVECPIGIGNFTTFYAPKFLSQSASRQIENRLHNSIKFHFRGNWRWYYNLTPTVTALQGEKGWIPHFWDEVNQMFLTGSRPAFTGLLDLQFDCELHHLTASEPHPDGSFKIICGFWPIVSEEEDRKEATNGTALRPWVCLYNQPDKTKPASRTSTQLVGDQYPARLHEAMALKDETEFLQFSMQVRELMRESLSREEEFTPPTSAILTHALTDCSVGLSNGWKPDFVPAGSRITLSLSIETTKHGNVIHNVYIDVCK